MSRKRRYLSKSPGKSILCLQKGPTTLAVLDAYLGNDIKKLNQLGDKLLKYQLEYYSVLANQRSRIYEQICNSLSSHTRRSFEFTGWQRSITYRWSTQPLSARGSLIDPGGRFNIGEIDLNRFPVFAALYIASDKETALQEHLGQPPDLGEGLDAFELALTNTQSISILSLSGKLESLVDLTDKKSLHAVLSSCDRMGSRFTRRGGRSLEQSVPELQSLHTPDKTDECKKCRALCVPGPTRPRPLWKKG